MAELRWICSFCSSYSSEYKSDVIRHEENCYHNPINDGDVDFEEVIEVDDEDEEFDIIEISQDNDD